MSSRYIIAILLLSAGLNAQLLPPFPGNHSISREIYTLDHDPLFPEMPSPEAARPISGVVSLHDLQHPIPEKALRAAYESQRLVHAKKTLKAIQKLEQAVRIAPQFRDAHNDLGVLYATVRRFGDARAEFQRALDIGPPAEPIYVNLALSSAALGDVEPARAFARKTLDLNPRNTVARKILESAAAH